MSVNRVLMPQSLAVIGRYFEAFEFLCANKTIASVNSYCESYGIDRRNFYVQRKDNNRRYFEVGWLVTLIDGYGVSCQWLLTGKGCMLKK